MNAYMNRFDRPVDMIKRSPESHRFDKRHYAFRFTTTMKDKMSQYGIPSKCRFTKIAHRECKNSEL